MDGDDPPEEPQLSVVDGDGLLHTQATRGPETDVGLFLALNLDLEPRPVGASVRVDKLSVGVVGESEPAPGPEKPSFKRGDANDDGTVNIADGVFVLNFLFTEIVSELPCPEAGDTNDDGGVNISDGLFILNYLFVGNGQAPPAPGPDACGENPSDDEDMTGCAYTSC